MNDENSELKVSGDLGPEWEAEIQRRVARLDAGLAELIPAEEVFEELAQKFGFRLR
jgi:hypothetical protein